MKTVKALALVMCLAAFSIGSALAGAPGGQAAAAQVGLALQKDKPMHITLSQVSDAEFLEKIESDPAILSTAIPASVTRLERQPIAVIPGGFRLEADVYFRERCPKNRVRRSSSCTIGRAASNPSWPATGSARILR